MSDTFLRGLASYYAFVYFSVIFFTMGTYTSFFCMCVSSFALSLCYLYVLFGHTKDVRLDKIR